MMKLDCKPHLKSFQDNMMNHRRAMFETHAVRYGLDPEEACKY